MEIHKIFSLYKYLQNGNSIDYGEYCVEMLDEFQIGYACFDEDGNKKDYLMNCHNVTIKELNDIYLGLSEEEKIGIVASNVLSKNS